MEKELNFISKLYELSHTQIKTLNKYFYLKKDNYIGLIYNLKAFFGMFFILIEILYYKPKKYTGNTIFYDISDNNIDNRKKFLNKYTGKKIDYFTTCSKVGIRGNYKKLFLIVFKKWIKSLFFILSNIFKINKINLYDYMLSCRILLKFITLNKINNIKQVYIFQSYYSPIYLVSLYMTSKDIDVWHILSNAPICTPIGYNNYISFHDYNNIITCTRFQNEEAKIMKNKGAFYYKNKKLWGNEDILISKKYSKKIQNNFKYQIGIYTQGYWCRNNKNFHLNKNEIKRGKFNTNSSYHKYEELMIETIINKYNNNENIKIAILPHPLEKNIYSNYGIKPYYFKYKNSNIDILIEKEKSSLKMEEIFIGINMYSTIGIERIEYGYNNIFFIQDNKDGYFQYGKYTTFGDDFIHSPEQLIKKIKL